MKTPSILPLGESRAKKYEALVRGLTDLSTEEVDRGNFILGEAIQEAAAGLWKGYVAQKSSPRGFACPRPGPEDPTLFAIETGAPS